MSLIALGLALAACGRTERVPAAAGPVTTTRRGPDLLVLRAPRAGGPARVYSFPKLDSVLWTSPGKTPPLERFLGFDDAAGIVLAEAPNGVAVRIDFHLNTVAADAAPKLHGIASADGSAAFGLAADGRVVRLTPSGTWSFKPPTPVREVLPQPDGQLLLLFDRPGGAVLWSVRPPDSAVGDSARLPEIAHAVPTAVGDRIYLTSGDRLLALRVRTLEAAPEVKLPHVVLAVETTPSGDRIYVAPDSSNSLLVLDRYTGKVASTIPLPAPASAIRMDPLGRLVLARVGADSVMVIAVGADRVIGMVRTAWRADLPAVAPNGTIALAAGADVRLVEPDSLKVVRTVSDGTKDLWRFFSWNGFRPRAAGLDEPVTFPEDTVVPHDSASAFATASPADSLRAADSARRAAAQAPPTPAPPPRDSGPKAPQFTVQFAALRTDSAARQVMKAIKVVGAAPHVVPNAHDGVITYRVVIGPFPTREDAEKVARTAGMSYWVYEGAP